MNQISIEFTIDSAEVYFQRIGRNHLEKWIAHYKETIDIEEDRFDPGVYPLHHAKAGRPRPYPRKIGSGYLANMKRGLSIAEQVYKQRFPEVGGNEGQNG